MSLYVIGVRHHSPACARLVAERIERIRPKHVLIEGPADFNTRISELFLGHQLPIAIFTFHEWEGVTHSSWTPFCRHSPEWIALTVGRKVGAAVRFMDLPSWTRPFMGVKNRYRDRTSKRKDFSQTLCERFRVDDVDSLWDHLFEQPLTIEELSSRLESYFGGLRQEQPASEEDGPREEFMSRTIAWAVADAAETGGDVVAVCGGFHAPALRREVARMAPPDSRPASPEPEKSARFGSYLVPYSWKRLDSFTGYEAGLPSPGYYDAVWEHGPGEAPEIMLHAAVRRLRSKNQHVSSADLIACSSLAHALARMRGHRCLARTDILDGIASAFVKDSMEVPLPWNYRGLLLPRTDPILVEVVAAFSGDLTGSLAAQTPRPPLVTDVLAGLARLGLTPGPAVRVNTLDLTKEDELEKSRFLHRLRVIGIPGFQREKGPRNPAGTELVEEWRVSPHPDAATALIEAGSWGATLELAVTNLLEEASRKASGSLSKLAFVLMELVFCGISDLGALVLEAIGAGVAQEPSFRELGRASPPLFSLWKYGSLFGHEGSQTLARVLGALFDRGLWLCEQIQGPAAPADPDELAAVSVMRDLARYGNGQIELQLPHADAVMQRTARDHDAPPALRGAAVGFRWSLGTFPSPEQAEAEAERVFCGIARVQSLGDFLTGLFALAREEVIHAPGLVKTIDTAMNEMTLTDFLSGLPALRLSFTYFPPRERAQIAKAVLKLHEGEAGSGDPASLLRMDVSPLLFARGLEIEAAVTELARKYGLE